MNSLKGDEMKSPAADKKTEALEASQISFKSRVVWNLIQVASLRVRALVLR